MEVVVAHPWKLVLDCTQAAEARHDSPFLWAVEIAGALHEADVHTPSLELAHSMVQHICSSGSYDSLWAYMEHSMATYLVYPVHAIALLTAKYVRAPLLWHCGRSRCSAILVYSSDVPAHAVPQNCPCSPSTTGAVRRLS